MKDSIRIEFQKALLVESVVSNRKSLRFLLLHFGVKHVFEAETGSEALTLMAEELVDIIFTPWEVPGISGKTLIKALRNHGRNRKVPVVLLDDGLPPEIIVSAIKAGVDGKLSLPGDSERLREVLLTIREGRVFSRAAG